jgi:hypothetical protein
VKGDSEMNRSHHISIQFHSTNFLKIQAMQSYFISFHSILFHQLERKKNLNVNNPIS